MEFEWWLPEVEQRTGGDMGREWSTGRYTVMLLQLDMGISCGEQLHSNIYISKQLEERIINVLTTKMTNSEDGGYVIYPNLIITQSYIY